MVICLERGGAGLHMAQLMSLPLTVSCFSKIQIGFTFLVLADPGSPGQRAVKRVCVLASCLCTSEYCRCVMVCKAELFAVFVVRSGEDKVLHRLVPLRRSAARRWWHRHGAGDDALPRPRQCTQDFHVPTRPKTPNAVTRPANPAFVHTLDLR